MRKCLHGAVVFVALALLPACGGSGGGGGGGPAPYAGPDWYVDALLGSNANSGALAAPFKSITKALGLATSGHTVHVAPGVYDAGNGEVFPLEVPPNVSLLGDEPNKGDGPVATLIRGGGLVPPPYVSILGCSLLPRSGSVIAGFRIFDDLTYDPTHFPYGLVMPDGGVTVRNNTIRDAARGGLYMFNNAGGHTITGNSILNSGFGPGLGFISGGLGSRVENNVITGNLFGAEYDSAGGDLGGGSAGSTGGNTLSCNTSFDIWCGTGITIDAQNNFWDHNPPTMGATGVDLKNDAGTTYVVTGAALATSPCP